MRTASSKGKPELHVEHSNIFAGPNHGESAAIELAKAIGEMAKAANTLAMNLKETGGNVGIVVGDYKRGVK
jgi:hypothetical protein